PLFPEGRPVREIGPAADMLVCIAASWSVCRDRLAAEDPIDDHQDGQHHCSEGPPGLPRPRRGRSRRRTARPLGRVLRSLASAGRDGRACDRRSSMVRACRYRGLAHDHPDFARFYAACAHHGLVVGLHPFPFPDVEWTQAILPDLAGAPSSRVVMADMVALPIDNMLTMAYLMFGGVCDRHPGLKFAFMESNATWVAPWIDRMEARFARGGHRLITTPPSEILA